MSFFSKFFGAGRFERAARRDFRPEDLPDTRVKLFFDALGIRWSAMVGLNLFYLLFWLPAILWSGINLLTLVHMLASPARGRGHGRAGVWPAVYIPAHPLAAGGHHWPGDGGRGLRLPQLGARAALLHGQRLYGARAQNWKQALAVSTITGALPSADAVFVALLRRDGTGREPPVCPPGDHHDHRGGALAFDAAAVYTMMVTYKLTLRQLLSNAMRMAVGKLPLFLGIRLLTMLLPVAMLIVFLYFPGRRRSCSPWAASFTWSLAWR